MTFSTHFSNAVFTLLPPEELPDPRFDYEEPEEEEEADRDDDNFYYKAVEGSYDKSYFIDEKTQQFRFPNYNEEGKCLVMMKDLTDYQEDFFSYLDEDEIEVYSIDTFEAERFYPLWDIEHFSDFLKRLPESYFTKGITRQESLELFDHYDEFINETAEADDYYKIGIENSNAFKEGFMEVAGKPSEEEEEDLWKRVPLELLNALCEANGLPTAKTAKTSIKRLREKNILFSFSGAKPSQLLKDYYLSFVNLYVEEIRRYIDHFHPRYLEIIWDSVRDACWDDQVQKKVDAILKDPYWKDRLYKVERPKSEYDYDDDEEEDEDEDD